MAGLNDNFMITIRTREFRDRLLLRGWSERRAARFARVWGQRYLKRIRG